MLEHEKINYVEFHCTDLKATKEFFIQCFNWEFEDFGQEYTAFSNQGIDGGFFQSKLNSKASQGSALLVFYSKNLIQSQQKIEQCGGKINVPIFSFPGGKRFHFTEPSGNEFAVWSEVLDKG